MAERRMFTGKITESDAFLEMPLSTQALYFHYGIIAENKGILINAKAFARAIGADDSDIQNLVGKGLLVKQNGYYVIAHWYENNGVGETAKKRISYGYRKWRESVLKRDGYMCQKCGSTSKLHAHHIKSFSDYPDERLEVSNGLTLCERCHRELHGLAKVNDNGC